MGCRSWCWVWGQGHLKGWGDFGRAGGNRSPEAYVGLFAVAASVGVGNDGAPNGISIPCRVQFVAPKSCFIRQIMQYVAPTLIPIFKCIDHKMKSLIGCGDGIGHLKNGSYVVGSMRQGRVQSKSCRMTGATLFIVHSGRGRLDCVYLKRPDWQDVSSQQQTVHFAHAALRQGHLKPCQTRCVFKLSAIFHRQLFGQIVMARFRWPLAWWCVWVFVL